MKTNQRRKNGNRNRYLFSYCLFLLVLTSVNVAEGSSVAPPENLWKGIIAEAVSEGESGMRAVTHVYKNRLERGMSLGCVAIKRKDLEKFVKAQGERNARLAKRIVREVFGGVSTDPTGGATHYENLKAFPEPYWWESKTVTVKIGVHTFCK